MEPLPGDAKRWTKQYVSPAKDFVTRQEVKDEEAERLTIGSSHPQASAYPDFTLVGFEPAQRGSQYAYYCKTRDAQWAYNYEHASTAGDELPTVSYTWIIPRADFKNTGEVQAIPANQMPTFGGAYVWTLVGARMVRFNDYLDGLFVQVIHDYWDKEHPIRTEELDTETGELREVTRALVPYGTDGTALNASGSISTYQHINERVGWMVTRKATGLLGGMVKGRKVRIKRGVKPHYWPKVLDYISVYPVHTDPRDVFSPISGYNTARKFLCEDYNGECKVTIVERITLKEPIFGGDPDWDTDSPSGDSPDIPVPTPLLEAGIRFDGTELVVNCESCLRQEYSFRDSGWMETFPASSPVRWPESRLVSVDVRPENGAWVTEYVMVDAPNGRGLSSGLDLIQRSAALSTSVEVKWTPQLASGSTQEVRIDVSTTGDFSGGFLTGFRDKLVTPANNTPADQWVNITGMERGSTYFVRVRRRNAGQDIATSNTLVVTSKPSPELSLTRDKVPVPASSTLQFGDVEVGKTARITILLNSIGLLQVQEIAARLSGDGEAVFGHDVPTVSLPPTVTAPLELRFSPTAVGVITATFTVTSDAIDSPLEITLRGIGAAAEIALEQPSGTDQPSGGTLSFGTVTTGSVSKVFKLTNTGNAPLRNITAAISGTNTADFTFTTLLKSTEIAAGGFAEFTIKFDPIESELAFGARAAVLTIGSNDGDENPLTLNLTGVSQSPTAPGALEASFNPSANGVVRAMITQAAVSYTI